ncbi:MAG TPA: DUF1800 domain-containing protein [Acidimicrobiales bacterium]|nr:DUF1800 domain-containing protein [Acidimicrobiales bacterium]
MADETRSLIAHLFRRAAFGARPADLDTYKARGYEAAVTDLTSARPATGGNAGTKAVSELGVGNTGSDMGAASDPGSLHDAQAVWVQAMVGAKAPLVERMTLFYADHFATAYNARDRIDLRALNAQLATIRKHSMGSFRDLLHAMLDDLALACYLDNDANTKGAPNENLARELMELFVLGRGNYTETDVREVARSLTGYTLQQTGGTGSNRTYKLVYEPARHDAGSKTVLGVTGTFSPHQVLDVILRHPAAPRFVAGKLVAHFLAPTNATSAVDDVAEALVANSWNVSAALRTLFMTPMFRSSSVRDVLVKSPAEYVVGLMRALGRTEYKRAALYIENAGQSLFRPPNVGGWPVGTEWLNAGSMLARYNAAAYFGRGHAGSPSPLAPATFDLPAWVETFGMTSIAPSTQSALENYMQNMASESMATKRAGLVTMLATTPDFNLA